MVEFIFIISILLIIYTYLGYPILLYIMPVKNKNDGLTSYTPDVTVIIAVHRGADIIKKKIDNTLASDYPEDKLEVIVVSDGSDDGTDEIIETYYNDRVRLIRQIPRLGKTAAQKKAVAEARNDVLVFTDVTTMLEKTSLRQLVSNLSNKHIGLVSSQDKWIGQDGSVTESAQGAYVKYEMWLRKKESEVSSIVSASGCFYCVRKKFFEYIPDYLIDDTVIPLSVVEKGALCIHDNKAISIIPVIQSARREFSRRARMSLGGINALIYKYKLLNPFRYGFFSLQLISHKFLRWLIPLFMITALISNVILVGSGVFWNYMLLLQITFYLFASYGYMRKENPNLNRPVKLIYFFTSSNLAILWAWFQFFTKRKQTIWHESRK